MNQQVRMCLFSITFWPSFQDFYVGTLRYLPFLLPSFFLLSSRLTSHPPSPSLTPSYPTFPSQFLFPSYPTLPFPIPLFLLPSLPLSLLPCPTPFSTLFLTPSVTLTIPLPPFSTLSLTPTLTLTIPLRPSPLITARLSHVASR